MSFSKKPTQWLKSSSLKRRGKNIEFSLYKSSSRMVVQIEVKALQNKPGDFDLLFYL